MTFPASNRASASTAEPIFRNLKSGGGQYVVPRIALIGQGATASTFATTKAQVFSANDVGYAYGYGSPLHLAALELLPANGDGVGSIPVTVYPMDDAGSGVASAGDITPSLSSQVLSTFRVRVNGIYSEPFNVLAADAVADVVASMVVAINAVPSMPVIASNGTTTVTIASKWKGVSANDITLAVDGPTDAGVTWAFTQPVSGANNPTVDASLAQIGPVWEMFVVNCLDPADTTAMDTLAAENVGRWDPQVWTPFVAVTGNGEATYATAVVVPDARPTDYTNVYATAQGSESLPCQIAARTVARLAKQANENAATSYNGLKLDTIYPGTDAQQWSYAQRNAAINVGCSTSTKEDGVVTIGDMVTFTHPTGETDPAKRYVVALVKLWNYIARINTEFRGDNWRRTPLLPDDQFSTNPLVKKPKDAVTAIAAITDAAAGDALIADPATAKASITAAISGSNNNRIDWSVQIQIAGNTNIKAGTVYYGFFYGGN